jgi:uncharacterized protein with HEPN domain
MLRDEATLLDLLGAARLVGTSVEDMDWECFRSDLKTQAAVEHGLMIVGEAATRLSEEFRERHDEVAWRQAIGMRNRLIHAYDVVSLEVVWQTAPGDIPVLLAQVENLVSPGSRGSA